MATALFAIGAVYITPGALRACASFPMPPDLLIVRHMTGDWAELDTHDRQANRQAITSGDRILSAYQVGSERFYVITEADRETTTVLLASEY